MVDPLLNPPTPDAAAAWTTSLLVLIPLRLGLDHLNDAYVAALRQTFAFPQSVGIIGGKKGHSVYFVGTQAENRLQLLDPHDVHPTAALASSFPTAVGNECGVALFSYRILMTGVCVFRRTCGRSTRRGRS